MDETQRSMVRHGTSHPSTFLLQQHATKDERQMMEQEREDGDNYDADREAATKARQWLRRQVDESRSRTLRSMVGDLRQLEQLAEPFFLGLDYDPDLSDVDEQGPF
jgi:predicted Holliday junction resolvase-like endonuclease